MPFSPSCPRVRSRRVPSPGTTYASYPMIGLTPIPVA